MHSTTALINLVLAVFLIWHPSSVDLAEMRPPILILKHGASKIMAMNSKRPTPSTPATPTPTPATPTPTPATPTPPVDQKFKKIKFTIAKNTRKLEIIGYGSSFLSIAGAIHIFSAFRTLQNKRTVIHKNLLCAIFFETFTRCVLYLDQALLRDNTKDKISGGLEDIPYVCEGLYIFLEYTRLVVYSWMLIEGIFLNTLVSANTLRNDIRSIYLYIGGWIVPIFIVGSWALVTAYHYSEEGTSEVYTCWYGYNYLPYYYIVQAPILAIIMINFLFLGSIMHVIVKKLHRTNNSELEKIKKAVRATLILMPLLGIGNIFNMFDYPLDGSVTGFAIWCYATHFFRSFQGFFISVIYCYTNGEVIKVLKKKWAKFTSRFWNLGVPDTVNAPNVPNNILFHITDNEELQMANLRWGRAAPSATTNNMMTTDIEMGAGPSNFDHMTDEEIQMANMRWGRAAPSATTNNMTTTDIEMGAEPSNFDHMTDEELEMANLRWGRAAPSATTNNMMTTDIEMGAGPSNFEIMNEDPRSLPPCTCPAPYRPIRAPTRTFVRPGLVTHRNKKRYDTTGC